MSAGDIPYASENLDKKEKIPIRYIPWELREYMVEKSMFMYLNMDKGLLGYIDLYKRRKYGLRRIGR